MNCACEEPSLLSSLATHSWLEIVWKILATSIQLACTCYHKLTCVLDFLVGNKQTNKQRNKQTKSSCFCLFVCFQMACLTFQLVCMKKWFSTGNYIHNSIVPYLLATNELYLLSIRVRNLLCIQTAMWLTVLIWKCLKITVFYKSCLWPQCCHN